jgi:TRAP transporter 4TM/12TM fusion protein
MSVDKLVVVRQQLIVWLSVVLVGFHLYTSAFGSFPDLIQRSVHVGLALMLAFCLYGFRRDDLRQSALRGIDVFLLLAVCAFTVHILFSYDRMMGFTFRMTTLDYVLGVIAVVLVLEGCRRVIGWTIPVLGMLGLVYAVLGPYLPDPLAHRGLDPKLVIEVLYMSTRGLYGMVTGISATVIAIFVIYGAVLLRTGGGQTFMDLAIILGGRSVGGGAKVATIASAFFGSVSGSAAANVATTGAFTIPLMKRLGYRPAFAGAVEAVASTGGQVMPPIMGAGAFIMAELLGISYLTIMTAALIPAALYFIGCLAGIHFESKRLGYKPVESHQLPKLREVFTVRRAGPVFLSLTLLIGMLVQGYSPGFAAFAATAILVVFFLLGARDKTGLVSRLKDLKSGFVDAGIGLVAIAVLIAGAQILLAMISTTGLGVSLTAGIIGMGDSSLFISLLLAMLIAMLLGTGLPTAAAYLLAAAVVAPALIKLGVEPLGAHMFIFYFSILAGLTPPLCATVFISASMAKANWVPTSLYAIRLSVVAFLIPFAFVFHPAILLQGSPWQIAVFGLTGMLGVVIIGAALAGYLLRPLRGIERGVLLVAAILLISPGWVLPMIGLFILCAAIVWHGWKK